MNGTSSGRLGRLAVLPLVGVFVVGACTSLGIGGVHVAPGSVSSAVPATPVATPTLRPTPAPTAAATPVPAASPVVIEGGAGGAAEEPSELEPAVIRLKPRPKAGPFHADLYRKGDFVHQATKDMCVAGSTATMMNIIDKGAPHGSTKQQTKLYQRGRKLSPVKSKLGPIGMDLIGWAELLNRGGYGPYEVASAKTRRGAVRKAAKALRQTGRPVGLVTWRGAHSWVMSGFKATADPAYSKDFEVEAVHIEDTWYPSVSTIWGASRPPDTLVPVAALAEDYLPYARPLAKWPKRDGRFMLILPVLPPNTVAR